MARLDLYRQSGHWQLYDENMYPPMRFEDGEELELRPVNCPHHIVVYQSDLRSYRDLPLRIAEIGNNWRYERSGTLIGHQSRARRSRSTTRTSSARPTS